jgi:carboxymethylenebutenolidase
MAGEIVRFPSNGQEAEGYLAKPASGSGPGVIVIQEWWGLVPHITDICDRFAAEGFVALAPDLYHGGKTSEPDEAMKLMMAMNIEQAAKDMSGAVGYLVGLDAAAGAKIGCTGFCMGGGLALVLASKRPEIGACVPFYGVVPGGAALDASKIQAAVQGHYAENDQFVPPAAARQLESELKAAGKEAEFFIYPGTGHGFFNDTRPDVHDPPAAKQAWERMVAFFRKHLG